MSDDNRIIELIAWHKAITAHLARPDNDSAYQRLVAELDETEKELAKLTPTTGPVAVELLDLLSEHDDVGLRAIGVLRGLVGSATPL